MPLLYGGEGSIRLSVAKSPQTLMLGVAARRVAAWVQSSMSKFCRECRVVDEHVRSG